VRLVLSAGKNLLRIVKVITVSIGLKTPKALANFSPGLERSDNPGVANIEKISTLKEFITRRTLTGFKRMLNDCSQGCRYAPTLG
jgi:hypothetical protein